MREANEWDRAVCPRRREFITLVAGAAAAWPLMARGQQKLPTIGFLGSTARWAESPRDAALLERLRELGWIEGRTVAIEHRWAENHMERYAEIATEFVRLRVDVIVTFGTAVPAFKQRNALSQRSELRLRPLGSKSKSSTSAATAKSRPPLQRWSNVGCCAARGHRRILNVPTGTDCRVGGPT